MKLCFVTVGATASFEKLIEQVLTSSFLEILAERHYTHLLIQYGKDGDKIYQRFLDSNQSHHGVTLGGFDFKPSIEDEMMMTVEREQRQQERGLIICHAGTGTVLAGLRLGVPLIVVPNTDLADNHQQELADVLEEDNYVISSSVQDVANDEPPIFNLHPRSNTHPVDPPSSTFPGREAVSPTRPFSLSEIHLPLPHLPAMAEATLHNVPIVIDNGSGTIRAGFAGEEIPSCYFPSFVGRPKHPRVMAGGLEGDSFIGSRAQELRGLLKIRYPLEHGIVTNWEDMESIWHYVYENELKTLPEEHPVLLTEPPLNPRQNRDIAAQLMFEAFNVPALYMSIQAVLSLYASGRTTGVVLDSGDGVSHAVPVFEGFAIPNSIRRIDVAGRDVTEQMQLLLRKAGHVLHTSAEKEVVRMIKEKVCYVSLDPKREEKEWMNNYHKSDAKAVDYSLPDGHKIKIGQERYRAPEILFDPELIGLEYPGVHQIVQDAITRTDLDLRKSLYLNIVLSGGSTLCKNFPDRLMREIKRLAVEDMKIRISAPAERKYTTWIGGSILAGLSTFRKMWVSADEWHEDPEVIHKRFA
ncbi:Glycosyl transferase family 28 C-terminal [Penicillium soppii]|uniref:Glycosyl transferase family 28 C-terminal n=1 Tax=Penicillium soppii TaxID=69789 RepID=UPI002546D0C4|nr:Glycosyl transferase family 28 C-terminal [Penicillium soppii]KAJ5871431.1 Glycosyl transferase family 28 C-terminal [Penicillium soppii]